MILNIKPATKLQAGEIYSVACSCLEGDERLADYEAASIPALLRSSMLVSVIVCDKVVRGFCVCEKSPIPDGCVITGIYIDEGFRGIGFGRKLLSYTLREVRGMKMKYAFIWVGEKNKRAEKFFRKIGFFPDGKRKLTIPDSETYELRYRIDI